MKAEVLFLRYYKVNPFEIMKDISLLDLQTYIKQIEEEEKKDQKKINKKDLITALKQICELLNYMFYKK
jgi:hypothetical protein